jgi:hypothetical protein
LKRFTFNKDYAEAKWKEGPSNGRPLKTLFGWYSDVEYNWDRLQGQGHDLLDASLFLNCQGVLRGDVFEALDDAVMNGEVEMVFHRTLSKAHTCLGLMCTTCRYCIAVQIGNPNAMGAEPLSAVRASLARWLGVEIPEDEEFGR